MFHESDLDARFFEQLEAVDRACAAAVQAKGCASCGGRLDRADYPRKVRGGWFGAAAEGETRRISLCCSREGCRKRVTPPSVRFLGRKVYLAVVVVLACVCRVQEGCVQISAAARGIPARTVRRWVTWWQTVFALGSFYREAKGALAWPVDSSQLPGGLLERFALPTLGQRLAALLRWLSPVTTGSCPNGTRLMGVQ